MSETQRILADIAAERARQDAKWGAGRHQPDGTSLMFDHALAAEAKVTTDMAFRMGNGSWRLILDEEVAEAFAESDPVKLRAELIQVAAVAAAWIEDIDTRGAS